MINSSYLYAGFPLFPLQKFPNFFLVFLTLFPDFFPDSKIQILEIFIPSIAYEVKTVTVGTLQLYCDNNNSHRSLVFLLFAIFNKETSVIVYVAVPKHINCKYSLIL